MVFDMLSANKLCSDKSFIKYHSYVHGAFIKTQTLLGVHRKVARTRMGEQQDIGLLHRFKYGRILICFYSI